MNLNLTKEYCYMNIENLNTETNIPLPEGIDVLESPEHTMMNKIKYENTA